MTGETVQLEHMMKHRNSDNHKAAKAEIFEVFVLSDPSSELPEELQILLDEAGLHFVYHTQDRDVFSTWKWDEIKRVRGQKQSNKTDEMEILNLQINTAVFCFEADDATHIAEVISNYKAAPTLSPARPLTLNPSPAQAVGIPGWGQDGAAKSNLLFEIFSYEDPTNSLPEELQVTTEFLSM